jgi:hypothetical protein
MAIDHRKFLKDCIRGMVYENDTPTMPCAIDENGVVTSCTDEELELFDKLVAEVLTEEGDTMQSVNETIAAMKRAPVRMHVERDANGNFTVVRMPLRSTRKGPWLR